MNELVRRDGKLEEEERFDGETVVLDAEPHVSLSPPEKRTDHHRPRRSLRRRDGGEVT